MKQTSETAYVQFQTFALLVVMQGNALIMAYGSSIAMGEIGDNLFFDKSALPVQNASFLNAGHQPSTPCWRAKVFIVSSSPTLADRIEDVLPQTQCTKCGYSGCRPYAEAIANGQASYNQCPPGGAQGVERIAALLGQPLIALNPANGHERPRPIAIIDEQLCIGCTLCLQACPVDAIVGGPKQMHTVLAEQCTGCDLCVAPCPVDCIAMLPATGEATGWQAWTQAQADTARMRHDRHLARMAQQAQANQARQAVQARAHQATDPTKTNESEQAKKRAIIQAALERAQAKKALQASENTDPPDLSNSSNSDA